MKILKRILQSNVIYLLIIIFLVFYTILFTKFINYSSVYQDGLNKITGRVESYTIADDKVTLTVKAKEKIIATYYLKNNEKLDDLKIGSKVTIEGEISDPKNNTIPNTFNYKNYLYNLRIYKTIHADALKFENDKLNVFERLKNFIYKRASGNEYLKLFIIGDKSSLEQDVYDNFKNIGVAHLLAVSGMHVSVFVAILELFLKFLNENHKKILISFVLIIYAYIVNFSASILRVVLVYILNFINTYFNLKLDGKKTLFWAAVILLLYNPFFIYQIGFLYSFITVLSILLTKKYLKNNYFHDIIIISFWALIFTLPITVSLNYEINLLTFLSNLILIPFVTFVLYPMALICFVLPFVLPIFSSLTVMMEFIINIFASINIFVINIPKMSFIVISIYYCLAFLWIYYNSKIYMTLIIMMITLIKCSGCFDQNYYVSFFDVGQGNSSVIISPRKKDVFLIDTGGIVTYNNKSSYQVSDNVILFLKSIGINKITALLLTHGDYDHMGDAINLIENFKVEKVIFNCGEVNDLEKELIKALEKRKIIYYSCIKELNIDNNKLYFLNNKDYSNENDNSNVIYTELFNQKFLFMGDAGVEVEDDLIEKYNLQDIDVIKVGHHGSKTSSGKEFINEVNPKYSIISVGKNNRYGHPNDGVLDNLEDSKIYRTDQDGSVMFKIKNNKLNIETCAP